MIMQWCAVALKWRAGHVTVHPVGALSNARHLEMGAALHYTAQFRLV